MASESLQRILSDASQTDALNNVRQYIPRHVLDTNVTRESVKAALKKSTAKWKIWPLSTKSIVDTVVSNNLKLVFVILLYLDVPWDVKKFHEAGFTDADLPMEKMVSKQGDRLQSGLDSKKLFAPPKHWNLQAENFVSKQWVMMAPIFGSSGEYQKLHPLCPLPLTQADGVIHSARNVVYKAEIQSSHQRGFEAQTSSLKIAIKEFRHKEDFKQERSNLSALRTLPNTKHIAQSLAAYSQGNRDYIISPWAEGGDLDNFWQTSHKGVTRTSKLALWSLDQMLGLANALYALHEELGDAVNCRHGDLKPGNILHFTVDKEQGDFGILKITDFGISRIHQEATFDRLNKPTITGATSPSYEAPEAVASQAARSRKYDIWSIGCIFLEFVIWLAQDWDAVQSFANARKSTSAHAGGAIPSHFYRIDEDEAVVHPEVFKIIKTLGRIPQSAPNTALGKLLSIIKEDLIKINSADRTDAKGLCNQLEAIVSKARSDPVYLWDSRY
ncbi:kinase-like domain-containing protein [Colletotrichum acutatum]|uniref:Kinase-like domain-containing protein n=1 Tax=Glomerella acutata TaxID=27357 RepID=A0AAD8UEH7_GLOAC|nr:kinase-like domain-containing protein [Colletotrichum acutatum]KAK1722436.1 kinase-like domain-containing protein [Colletotrichum acutatum]